MLRNARSSVVDFAVVYHAVAGKSSMRPKDEVDCLPLAAKQVMPDSWYTRYFRMRRVIMPIYRSREKYLVQ